MKNNIRKLRKERNLTLEYVSDRLKIGKSSLSKIETGHQNLYADTAADLANLFNVSLDELLCRDWVNKDNTVVKTVDFGLPDILKKLNTFSDKELFRLSGAIDFVIENRDDLIKNPQRLNNTIDRLINSD